MCLLKIWESYAVTVDPDELKDDSGQYPSIYMYKDGQKQK